MGIGRAGPAILRTLGSLQAAVVLLLLLMTAMGSATVYESLHGTELALRAFYRAGWFRLLLWLLAANLAAALAVRYPFRRSHTPFVLAHGGLLAVLAGALLTALFGTDGQITLAEGETMAVYLTPGDEVTLERSDAERVSADLTRALSAGPVPRERTLNRRLELAGVSVEILRYAPDVVWEERVVDDAPDPHTALEVVLTGPERQHRAWVFGGESAELGGIRVRVREIGNPEAWRELLAGKAAPSRGTVQVRRGAEVYEFPLERCLGQAVPLGDTGFTVRVIRYLPHAVVGPDRTLVNASDEPVNPAIEAEIAGAGLAERRFAFARFPDFHGRGGSGPTREFTLQFRTPEDEAGEIAVELLAGPGGELAARFGGPEAATAQPLGLGQARATPWPGRTLTVTQRLDRARRRLEAVSQEPPRRERQPALYVAISAAGGREEFWLPKGSERAFEADGARCRVRYADRLRSLGFAVTLERFRIGYYPGGERPRSFESRVHFTGLARGKPRRAVIRMNRPASCRGYRFYQSSYQQQGDRFASTLSVARDPGRPVVFLGYGAVGLGMALLLARRLGASAPGGTGEAAGDGEGAV